MATINTDIYNMSQVLLDVQKEYFEEETQDTLALGVYGFINAVCSKMMQTSIKVASEMSNEIFPTKARLEKNIITHAITNNITDINAVPANIEILLCLLESDFNELLTEQNLDQIVIDKNCKFFIGEYEYHLDYDMIVSKNILANNVSVYTARYHMPTRNILSNVEVPYLASPYVVTDNSDTYIFISCHLRQVEQYTLHNKLITNDNIDNKTYEFEFENQLASFDVYVKEAGSTIHLVPIFEGSNTEGVLNYCWYTYIDSTTIRVKFDSASYMPRINAEIETDIKTTQGEKCNFVFKEDIIATIEDTDRYKYNSMQIAIRTISDSKDGQDKKSISELRRIFPKEALSRGSLINMADLNNYFNILNSRTNRMLFIEKIHNQFERTFYSYILIKDTMNNIVPTNTIDIMVKESEFDLIINPNNSDLKQYSFKQNSHVGYRKNTSGEWIGELMKDPTPEELADYEFIYTIPFKATINHSGPLMSYYMTTMDDTYKLIFSYINDNTPLQFICSTVKWTRDIIKDSDKYILTIDLKQNIDVDMNILTEVETEDGTVIESSLKVLAIIYDDADNPYRYMIADLDDYSTDDGYVFTYKFKFNTPDVINEDNCIRIDNTYIPMSEPVEQYGYFQQNIKVDIYVLNKFKDEDGNPELYGIDDLDKYILPSELEGYSITNKYSVLNGLTFFDNYSGIISTVVTPENIYDEETEEVVPGFKLSGVPVIRYSYAQNSRNIINFINSIKIRKAYIDEALKIIENQFGIDFKFYNTYGPARIYSVTDNRHSKLNKVNISLNFNLSVKKSSDDYTREYILKHIKDYIENLDRSESIHIPNLISDITRTYINSINYIEFRGFNGYTADYQHLYYPNEDTIDTIPEFVCINTLHDGRPDINIKIV